jgi:hypothetical protein
MVIIPRLELGLSNFAVPKVKLIAIIPVVLPLMDALRFVPGAANVSSALFIDPCFPRYLAGIACPEMHRVSIGPAVISLVDA